MSETIGQYVHFVKPNMSRALGQIVQHHRAMETNEELLFNAALCARVRAVRHQKGWTAEQMAMALSIPADRYRKYENRTPMPQYLIPKLALIVGRSVEWMMTGREPRSQNDRLSA